MGADAGPAARRHRRVADERQPDWARLAAELGYCDQAHLIRAFKAAIGMTPAEYVRRSLGGSAHAPEEGLE